MCIYKYMYISVCIHLFKHAYTIKSPCALWKKQQVNAIHFIRKQANK